MHRLALLTVLVALLAACPPAAAAVAAEAAPAQPAVQPAARQAAAAPADAAATIEKTSTPGMAGTTVEEFKVPSPEMKRDIEVVVVLPPAYAREAGKRFPVLYTLHGRGASFRVFKDMTTVHKAIAQQPMIVVGFNADRASWYLDATKKNDSRFTTFFFKTLVPAVDKLYRTRADAPGRAVTGFSMGGFGAFHLMLAKPDAFASASGMSGAFEPLGVGWLKKDFVELLGTPEENARGYAQVRLGDRIKAAAKKRVKLPPVYIACGTEDALLPQSQAMRDLAKKLGLKVEYVEAPGAHKFTYWKAAATGVIDFHWRTFQPDYKPVDHSQPADEPKTGEQQSGQKKTE